MASGLLESAEKRGTVYTVAMDEVKFLVFGQNGLSSIGTDNLNGCSSVMIVSRYAAILGHFPPRPNVDSRDLEAGDNHVRAKMREVAALYNSNSSYFVAGGHNWKIMEDALAALGLSHSLRTYEASLRRDPKDRFPGHGSVFVDGSGQVPIVYIEDKEVSKRNDWVTSLSAPVNDLSQAGSQGPYYYVKDRQYFLYDAGKDVLQAHKPRNVWVLNEKGWTDGNGMKWRYWDGKTIGYSE
ncbi:MAG: hypothetical protein M1818_003731 [Claussenomyces sp. TS43310]|nr:MAG: hypothetical protein M1818_003731 [Claussenomyces sp. TS43310]